MSEPLKVINTSYFSPAAWNEEEAEAKADITTEEKLYEWGAKYSTKYRKK